MDTWYRSSQCSGQCSKGLGPLGFSWRGMTNLRWQVESQSIQSEWISRSTYVDSGHKIGKKSIIVTQLKLKAVPGRTASVQALNFNIAGFLYNRDLSQRLVRNAVSRIYCALQFINVVSFQHLKRQSFAAKSINSYWITEISGGKSVQMFQLWWTLTHEFVPISAASCVNSADGGICCSVQYVTPSTSI